MINWTRLTVAAPLGLIFTVGCAGAQEPEDTHLREAAQAALSPNALSPNALSPNALSPNALSPNALSPNALSPNALSPDALAALQDPGPSGDLSRQHLEYSVSCALDASQSFSFTWVDSTGVVQDETYPGLLGLEPTWATEALSPRGQLWISACLAARTNYFGVQVIISLRAGCQALDLANTPEVSTYTMEEGAFWGNVYGSTPALYACHVTADDVNSRSQDRDCAAGHVDPTTGVVSGCGMIQILGDCADYCTPIRSPDLFHRFCWSDPENPVRTGTLHAITVALQ